MDSIDSNTTATAVVTFREEKKKNRRRQNFPRFLSRSRAVLVEEKKERERGKKG